MTRKMKSMEKLDNGEATLTQFEDDDTDVAPPVPPDGGWGWIVVIGALFCNIIVDGVCFSYGVFYVEFVNYFQASRAKTAIVGSLIPGMYLGMGPVVSALANKFGCRPVVIGGSIIAAVSFLVSTFSPNVDVLIFTYGIMGGIGFGLMYLPSIVIVGFYFHKRRALATGLAVCGSGIGTFLFAPFGRFLLDNYGWKGGYWIISGIVLNGCVCGALFRPLVATPRKKPKELKEINTANGKPHGPIFEKTIKEKERNRKISTGSLDGCVIARDNSLIREPEKFNNLKNIALTKLDEAEENAYINGEEPKRYKNIANSRVAQLRGEAQRCRPPAPLPKEAQQIQHQQQQQQQQQQHQQQQQQDDSFDQSSKATAPLLDSDALISSTRSLSFFPPSGDLPPMRSRSLSESRRKHYRISRTGEKVEVVEDFKDGGSKFNLSVLDFRAKEVARPMNRKDIFYTGSVANLREFKDSPDMDTYMASLASIPPATETRARCAPLCGVLKEMLDFSLMKSPTFLLLCSTSVLAMTGFFTPFVYIADRAMKLGIDELNAAMLLSVLGACNTMGRVVCGFVSDMPWADCLLIHNVALIIAGVTTCIVPLLDSFPLLVAYCVVFGFCIAAFITLRSIVLVDLLGLQKLTSSFGLLLLFQGIASLCGSPIAGAIFDATKSYQMSFIVSGVLIALSGFIALPVRRLAAWESKRFGPLGGESTYTKVNT